MHTHTHTHKACSPYKPAACKGLLDIGQATGSGPRAVPHCLQRMQHDAAGASATCRNGWAMLGRQSLPSSRPTSCSRACTLSSPSSGRAAPCARPSRGSSPSPDGPAAPPFPCLHQAPQPNSCPSRAHPSSPCPHTQPSPTPTLATPPLPPPLLLPQLPPLLPLLLLQLGAKLWLSRAPGGPPKLRRCALRRSTQVEAASGCSVAAALGQGTVLRMPCGGPSSKREVGRGSENGGEVGGGLGVEGAGGLVRVLELPSACAWLSSPCMLPCPAKTRLGSPTRPDPGSPPGRGCRWVWPSTAEPSDQRCVRFFARCSKCAHARVCVCVRACIFVQVRDSVSMCVSARTCVCLQLCVHVVHSCRGACRCV